MRLWDFFNLCLQSVLVAMFCVAALHRLQGRLIYYLQNLIPEPPP